MLLPNLSWFGQHQRLLTSIYKAENLSFCALKARERSGRSGCNFVGVLGRVSERFRKKNSSDPTTIKNFNLFSMKSRFHLSSAYYIFFGFKISEVCRNLIVAGTKKISILDLKLFVLCIRYERVTWDEFGLVEWLG